MNKMEKTSRIRTVCVYCGSAPGTDPAFIAGARALGQAMAAHGVGLIYGGGGEGMMGEVASAVMAGGGTVTGIIPEFLVVREHAHKNVPNMIVTRDMHERKRKMFEMADAFVALPGGIGTLEELVEQLTWVQLGRHKKPVLLANIAGFWDPLGALIDHMRKLEFIRGQYGFELLIADDVDGILPMLEKAAEAVPDDAKAMTAADPERL